MVRATAHQNPPSTASVTFSLVSDTGKSHYLTRYEPTVDDVRLIPLGPIERTLTRRGAGLFRVCNAESAVK